MRKNFIAKCNLAKGFVKTIAPGEWGYSHNIFLMHTYEVPHRVTSNECLTESLLMSAHIIYFHGEIRTLLVFFS